MITTNCYLTDWECMKIQLLIGVVGFFVIIVIPVSIITWREFHKK